MNKTQQPKFARIDATLTGLLLGLASPAFYVLVRTLFATRGIDTGPVSLLDQHLVHDQTWIVLPGGCVVGAGLGFLLSSLCRTTRQLIVAGTIIGVIFGIVNSALSGLLASLLSSLDHSPSAAVYRHSNPFEALATGFGFWFQNVGPLVLFCLPISSTCGALMGGVLALILAQRKSFTALAQPSDRHNCICPNI